MITRKDVERIIREFSEALKEFDERLKVLEGFHGDQKGKTDKRGKGGGK